MRSAPVGVVVFCAGMVLAALVLLALDVAAGQLTAMAALALVGIVLVGALAVALVFGLGKIRKPTSMWEILPFWALFTLACERILDPTAALATALMYPAVVIGLRLFVPTSWLRVETRPWMHDAGEAAPGGGIGDAAPGGGPNQRDHTSNHTSGARQDTSRPGWLRRRRREAETADVVPRAVGTDRDVSVALVDVPVFRSESGPRLRLRDVDATVWMLDAVDDWLPRAVPPASRHKPWHCPVCVAAQPLDAGQAEPVTHELEARPREGPSFVLEVTIPSVSCPGCGRALSLFDEERADALREAIIAALEAAGIHRE